MEQDKVRFARRVIIWYKRCGRDLPWRHTHDPYRILVSEIMLQQTQVDRVIPKYKDFLRTFPTLKSLAEAPTAKVIQAWRGLGYNRRALFLQRAAQKVQKEHGGIFPRQHNELLTLPGVGEYTARAVSCFAFLKSVAVLDTNHRKFYRRFLSEGRGVSDDLLLEQADDFVLSLGKRNPSRIYDWNQGIMDFMTAVARNDENRLIQEFIQKFPVKSSQKKAKKKTVRFQETDRFIRGRIVDLLRDNRSMHLIDLYTKIFPQFTQERLEQVIVGLIKDGLIKSKKQVIVLV